MVIRKAVIGDERGIASVQVQSWKETYKGIIKDEILDNMEVDKREDMWKKILEENVPNRFTYIAVNEDNQIVGFASGGENRTKAYSYDAELYTLYLLAENHARGIGKE